MLWGAPAPLAGGPGGVERPKGGGQDDVRPFDIEAWARRVIAAVSARQPNEDALVELKAEWPADPQQAARRLAGHAIAARGEPVLWLVGVDQDRGVMGAEARDLAGWWPEVVKYFDPPAPRLTDLRIRLPITLPSEGPTSAEQCGTEAAERVGCSLTGP